jgi:hypothetical protein
VILTGYVSTARDVVVTIAAAVSIALIRLVWKLGERVIRLEALDEARWHEEPDDEPESPDELEERRGGRDDWLGPG